MTGTPRPVTGSQSVLPVSRSSRTVSYTHLPAIADMIFIFLCDGVLLLFCAHANWFGLGKKRGIVLSSLPLGGCIVLSVPFNADRLAQQLTIMLDPYPYIKSGGYWTVILHELLENASFIGQGGVGTYSGQHFDRWGRCV